MKHESFIFSVLYFKNREYIEISELIKYLDFSASKNSEKTAEALMELADKFKTLKQVSEPKDILFAGFLSRIFKR